MWWKALRKYLNLHSIMYLLIHCQASSQKYDELQFTFHNVSINSPIQDEPYQARWYLHSIMYLLILSVSSSPFTSSLTFTFHNVSINSVVSYVDEIGRTNLHSIMYLLIRITAGLMIQTKLFTFHNVSINSSSTPNASKRIRLFTFHNVSINSKWNILYWFVRKHIYIP